MRDFYEVTCACQPFHDHSKVRPPAAQQTSDHGLLTSLDKKYMKNNRPISNLPFLSKIVEKVVLHRLLSHPQANSPYILFQSAYRAGHSTETVLLRVVNDILFALDNDNISVLLLLDLSAAFDTIDHQILLSLLYSLFGIQSTALFESYFSDRCQFTSVNNSSSPLPLLCASGLGAGARSLPPVHHTSL